MKIALTNKMIQADIQAYRARIKASRIHLSSLPATADNLKDRKKIRDRQRALNDDIRHCKKLISYAEKALT